MTGTCKKKFGQNLKKINNKLVWSQNPEANQFQSRKGRRKKLTCFATEIATFSKQITECQKRKLFKTKSKIRVHAVHTSVTRWRALKLQTSRFQDPFGFWGNKRRKKTSGQRLRSAATTAGSLDDTMLSTKEKTLQCRTRVMDDRSPKARVRNPNNNEHNTGILHSKEYTAFQICYASDNKTNKVPRPIIGFDIPNDKSAYKTQVSYAFRLVRTVA